MAVTPLGGRSGDLAGLHAAPRFHGSHAILSVDGVHDTLASNCRAACELSPRAAAHRVSSTNHARLKSACKFLPSYRNLLFFWSPSAGATVDFWQVLSMLGARAGQYVTLIIMVRRCALQQDAAASHCQRPRQVAPHTFGSMPLNPCKRVGYGGVQLRCILGS